MGDGEIRLQIMQRPKHSNISIYFVFHFLRFHTRDSPRAAFIFLVIRNFIFFGGKKESHFIF